MNIAKFFNHDFIKDSGFCLFDENNNLIFFENSDGYWDKSTYDKNDNEIYFENSNGYWEQYEYDKDGNETYFENSEG